MIGMHMRDENEFETLEQIVGLFHSVKGVELVQCSLRAIHQQAITLTEIKTGLDKSRIITFQASIRGSVWSPLVGVICS